MAPSGASPRNRLRGRSPRSNRTIQRRAVRILIRRSPPDVEVFHFRAPALPAQRILGGGSEGGRSPPPSGTDREYASRAALGRRLAAGPFSSLSPERFSDRLVRARAVPSSPRVGTLAGKRLDNRRSGWRAPSRLQDLPVLNEQASPALGAQPERSGKSSGLTRVKPDGSRRWRPRGSRARACGLARYPAGSESPRIPPPRWPPATARA